MNIVTDLVEWQSIRKNLKNTLGFIPTMGNLHEGHLSLCRRAKKENVHTVVSIFVNPTQFNQQQDFSTYPRTLEEDITHLKSCDIDYLFLPTDSDLYPDHYTLRVTEEAVSTQLEGEHRPGHFNGMLTVVLKLLNLTQATRAYFGEKDFQQLLLIQKMVAALFLPVEICACPTQRAPDGLALSSRNNRLNPQQREFAAHFPRLLQSSLSTQDIENQLQHLGFKVDYIADKWQRRLGAVWLDDIRLIDNIPEREQ